MTDLEENGDYFLVDAIYFALVSASVNQGEGGVAQANYHIFAVAINSLYWVRL